MDADLIVETLEMAADRCTDLAPLVYRRLFLDHPGMETLFSRDRNDAVKGEMLARVIEAILDFVGDRRYAARLIQCEVITHAGYDVPPSVFGVFFDIVADTIRDLLGADWSEEMGEAWNRTLTSLHYYASHPDQTETGARDR
jgi:hemoglobin-like flavoprotein